MNRRTFLTALSAASAGFVLDPERLLWRPGQRTYFLPSRPSFAIGNIVSFSRLDRAAADSWTKYVTMSNADGSLQSEHLWAGGSYLDPRRCAMFDGAVPMGAMYGIVEGVERGRLKVTTFGAANVRISMPHLHLHA